MSLKVMLVEESRPGGSTLEGALRGAGHVVAARLAPGEDLLGSVEKSRPDVVVVGLESPNEDALGHLDRLHRKSPRPVLVFSSQTDRNVIEQAIRSGVSVYTTDPPGERRIEPLLDVAIARFQEFQSLRQELEDTRAKLSDRKSVDRAKGLLMTQRGLAEPEAYAALRKMAMDRNQTLGEAARNLISVLEALG